MDGRTAASRMPEPVDMAPCIHAAIEGSVVDRCAFAVNDDPYAVATNHGVESLWRLAVPWPDKTLNHGPFGRCRLAKPVAGPQNPSLCTCGQAVAGYPVPVHHGIGGYPTSAV